MFLFIYSQSHARKKKFIEDKISSLLYKLNAVYGFMLELIRNIKRKVLNKIINRWHWDHSLFILIVYYNSYLKEKCPSKDKLRGSASLFPFFIHNQWTSNSILEKDPHQNISVFQIWNKPDKFARKTHFFKIREILASFISHFTLKQWTLKYIRESYKYNSS